MKIVYTITGMYNSGGMERVLANKANYLSHAKGVDGKSNKVIIITTDQKNRKPFFYLFEEAPDIVLSTLSSVGWFITNGVTPNI